MERLPGAEYATGETPYGVAIGDSNGDQVLDMAVANTNTHDVSVLLGAGDGTFADAGKLPVGLEPYSVAIGDLDGDQMLDLVVANHGHHNVTVLLNHRPLSCEGDANGDGLVDPLDSGFVLARFGCPVGTGDANCDIADQNSDGLVDPLDVGFVLARFGDCL